MQYRGLGDQQENSIWTPFWRLGGIYTWAYAAGMQPGIWGGADSRHQGGEHRRCRVCGAALSGLWVRRLWRPVCKSSSERKFWKCHHEDWLYAKYLQLWYCLLFWNRENLSGIFSKEEIWLESFFMDLIPLCVKSVDEVASGGKEVKGFWQLRRTDAIMMVMALPCISFRMTIQQKLRSRHFLLFQNRAIFSRTVRRSYGCLHP